MKRKLIFFGILAVIILLILLRIFSGSTKKTSQAASPAKVAIPVEVIIVRDTSLIYRISTIGSLRANESVAIVSEISKKVVGVFLREGSNVSKGQLLFKLDDADIIARINKLSIEETLAETNERRQKAQLTLRSSQPPLSNQSTRTDGNLGLYHRIPCAHRINIRIKKNQ